MITGIGGGGGATGFSFSDEEVEALSEPIELVERWVCNGGGGGALPLSRAVLLCPSSFLSIYNQVEILMFLKIKVCSFFCNV